MSIASELVFEHASKLYVKALKDYVYVLPNCYVDFLEAVPHRLSFNDIIIYLYNDFSYISIDDSTGVNVVDFFSFDEEITEKDILRKKLAKLQKELIKEK